MADEPNGRYRLVEALRRAIRLSIETRAPDHVLETASEAIDRASDEVALHPAQRLGEVSRPLTENSPIHGWANPTAPPATYTIADGKLTGTVTLGPQHETRAGVAHGGIVALLFDDLLGALEITTESPGVTGELTIRYLRPTPVGKELQLEARIDRLEARKIYASGTVSYGGEVCAEAEAVFIGPLRA
jgi:acyl-coenzyme A thioesterase PaaI-like protein